MFNPRNPLLTDVGLLLLRLVVGVVFIYHGGQKLFDWWAGEGIDQLIGGLEAKEIPYPRISAYLAAIAEFGGGILVLVGFFTRLAAIPMIITMGVAVLVMHPHAFRVDRGGMEFALTLGVVLIAILLSGPGRFSVDRLIWPAFQRRRAQRKFKDKTRAEVEADLARKNKP